MLEHEYQLSWLERLATSVIKNGPMPKHIAIILDGNRRFARQKGLGSVTEGHKVGAVKIDHVIDMLLHLEIPEVTLYAFSIENFKRVKEEVDGIMALLEEKFSISDEKIEKSTKRGVSLEVLGNLEDTPTPSLRKVMETNMLLLKENKRIKVNLAFIYTGRNEIAKGATAILNGVTQGHIDSKEITEELFQETFTLHPSNPVDILIRTSGESRLSDFVLWGCSEAYLEFVNGTWPEYTFWGLLATIFRFQNQMMYKGMKSKKTTPSSESELKPVAKRFVKMLRMSKWEEMSTKSIAL